MHIIEMDIELRSRPITAEIHLEFDMPNIGSIGEIDICHIFDESGRDLLPILVNHKAVMKTINEQVESYLSHNAIDMISESFHYN